MRRFEQESAMTAKSDLVLYDRHGQLAALVIIKNKRGTTRDWATQFRRNILASEALPPVPFLQARRLAVRHPRAAGVVRE